jgi:hypothetical protein
LTTFRRLSASCPRLAAAGGAGRGGQARLELGVCLLAITVALGATRLLAPQRALGFGVALQTAISMYPPDGAEGVTALEHVHGTGARLVRLAVSWRQAAPASPPPGFDPANPNDPAYNWSEFDRLVRGAVASGLEPMIDIMRPPSWAQAPLGAGVERPDPAQLGLFAHVAASRYDGSRPGLPWVRYWEVWNEPNVSFFLQPQIQSGRIVSVDTYRTMVNDFAAGVHRARRDNLVIGGELFPNGVNRPGITAIAPLDFTRRLFCLSAGARPRRVCNTRVAVDVWSVHPYTSGGPSTRPANPDNIWIANLQSLTNLVRAAQRLSTLTSTRPAQTWVTEFSWDSNPPDPQGVPLRLEQRWVAETLYRSWQAGINVFTWFGLWDQPLGLSLFQSGLYFACSGGIYCDTPKPAAAAFRFPFVAYPSPKRRVLLWGRTPEGVVGSVSIQWRQGRHWRALATLATDPDGIFSARLTLPREASPTQVLLRAVDLGVGASPSFSLHRPPDIPVTPFGS